MVIKLGKINNSIISKISKEIFIYPTDTIYGIGCNAKNTKLVEKIRKIKQRDKKPFSIIAPNIDYILKNSEYPSALILSVIEPNGERSFVINGESQDDLYWEDLPLEQIMKASIFYCSAYIIQRPPIK